MNRMPPPEGPTAPPGAHVVYDQWRASAYPPAFDGNAPEARRSSATAQTPLPPGYPVMPNRELPQLPPEGPYGRPNSLPGNAHPMQESPPAHANYRPTMNGTPHEASPHSAPPDYRARMGYEPPPQSTPSEGTPSSAPPPSSVAQFMTPAQAMPPNAQAQYDPSYYQNPAYGARRGKASRAQQVSRGLGVWHRVVTAVNTEWLRPAINVEQGKPSVMRAGRLAVIAKTII